MYLRLALGTFKPFACIVDLLTFYRFQMAAVNPICMSNCQTYSSKITAHFLGLTSRYMAGYKCTVTGSNSTKQVAPGQAPVYCEDDESKCVAGAKQMIASYRRPLSNSLILSFEANLVDINRAIW